MILLGSFGIRLPRLSKARVCNDDLMRSCAGLILFFLKISSNYSILLMPFMS